MGFVPPSTGNRLAAQLRSLSKFTMSESEAAQAADNLVGFVRLLPKSAAAGLKEVMRMRVTEVDIAFVKPKNGLIAFASVVLDDQLYLSGIAVHSKLAGSGYRLTYPTRKIGEAQFSLFHLDNSRECRANFCDPDMSHRDEAGWLGMLDAG